MKTAGVGTAASRWRPAPGRIPTVCGFAGWATSNVAEETIVRRMTDAVAHRGPDGQGFYLSPDMRVALGSRRLSIIDLPGGQQPMSNEDGSVWVIFNCEIYNFLELRANLEEKGHRFATKSDTEVIVHAYEEFGDDCVVHLNGMFAFAIYDEHRP